VQGVRGFTADGAFSTFKKNLNSRSLQKKFIDEYSLMDILAPNKTPETRDIEILEDFSKMIKTESEGDFSVSMESDDPEFAAKLINDYVSFFDLETVRALVSDARNTIDEQIMDIEYKIASKRQMTKLRREDQVLRYQEAITIARALGIKKRVDATNIIQNTQMNVDIATASTPLYYLGIEALSAEINILINRESDDPFISGLRDLQEQLALLRSIKIEEEGMHAVTVDQAAYPPKTRIKPNRRLIVSLGTVVGLFLGIFLVFFVSFVQKQKVIHPK
jgi:chain length determinant protein (polysaccharide antigen chain regulator)